MPRSQHSDWGTASTPPAAIASLVLGIIGLVAPCSLVGLLAIIFGAVARSNIAKSNGTLPGGGMALAGIILGILGILGSAVWLGVCTAAL